MPAVPSVSVKVLDQPYEVRIEPGALTSAGEPVAQMIGSTRSCIITDEHVAPLYLSQLRSSFPSEIDLVTVTIPPGEDHKNLATVSRVYDQILQAKIDRRTPVIALGGGVVGDLTGFVAATVLRGVPFVQIPTTLLAMVDASVGGKTGVDHRVGKNLIGAFHQPIAVIIDPETLKTLPKSELRNGLAECIKHEIIRDADGFALLEENIHRALALDMHYLAELIAHNVSIKARVVETDPFERAERAHLNLGHTFGHAIETISNYSYAHGECVALGMVAAARTAMKLDLLDAESVKRITNLILAAGLPTGKMALDVDQVIDAMIYDKKVKSGKIRFILPDRIGHVIIRDDVPPAVVREAVESLRE